jgi:hypothetical protein
MGEFWLRGVVVSRAEFKLVDRELGRAAEGTACAAVLIADGELHIATDPATAFDQIVAAAHRLKLMLPKGSQRAAACYHLAAYGRAAVEGDRSIHGPHKHVTSASQVLQLAEEVLGHDAADKLRRAAAEHMGCR